MVVPPPIALEGVHWARDRPKFVYRVDRCDAFYMAKYNLVQHFWAHHNIAHFKVGLFWTWAFLAHFCNTCHPFYFYLKDFTFILHHLVLMLKNTFSHIIILVWTPCLMHRCVCIWRYILQNYNYKLHFQNLFIYDISHVSIGILAAENLDVCTACDPWDSNTQLTVGIDRRRQIHHNVVQLVSK